MPRRELLSEPQRLAFTEPAATEREMVRHYTLSSEDLALIDRRRGDLNRLGFAVHLCYLRFPGRTLRQERTATGPFSSAVVADIDIDGEPLLYPLEDVVICSLGHSTIENAATQAAALMSLDVTPDPGPEEGEFCRSGQQLLFCAPRNSRYRGGRWHKVR